MSRFHSMDFVPAQCECSRVGRITGTVIGTIILGVMTSGFTFLRVDAYYQEIVKGIIIVGAVVVDQYRQQRRRKA